jgi:hypothetical protein
LLPGRRSSVAAPIAGDPDARFVAIGAVRSETPQIVKALAREIAISAQLRDVGLKFEMLVADRERGYRDGGAPSDTKRHALLDYASSGHVDVVTALP